MPRQLLKRIVPPPHALQDRWFVRLFGKRISDPQLWTLHRRGVTYAFGAGLAICFIPLPVHLLTACTIAMIWRLNVPVICGTTFFLNPFTAVPVYYLAYRVGAALLHTPPHHFRFHPNWEWFRLDWFRSGSRSSSAASPVRWCVACSAGSRSSWCGAGR